MNGRGTYNAVVSTELAINCRDDDVGIVLALVGELDVISAPDLARRLETVLAQPHPRVVLELSELRFVDSAGVSVLIKAKRDFESRGRTLVLRHPTEHLERVFALVGLADWLAYGD